MKNSFVSAKKIQRDMIIEKYFDKKSKLDLNTGDVVKLGIKIDEGKNERIQYYEGLIIKGKNSGISETITVRRIVQGIGTERVVPLNSPNLVSIEQKRSSIVRRSKLYYLRTRRGKSARIAERQDLQSKKLENIDSEDQTSEAEMSEEESAKEK